MRVQTSVVAAMACAWITAGALATDRYVPSGYPTIQAAIDASSDDDRVFIEPGTYHETFDVDVQGLTIRSTTVDPNDVIIEGWGLADHIAHITLQGSPRTIIFQYLTIARTDSGFAGIRAETSVRVDNCVVRECLGRGIHADGPVVAIDSIFTLNQGQRGSDLRTESRWRGVPGDRLSVQQQHRDGQRRRLAA